jgi:alkanesulfonate monooxygenase SsuD/methylene tetrahydromethanopterin reductase-like flavin-dependent oxidoreductase (luciferase family)
MRVGVLMLPTDPWPESLARARRIEAMGYDHLWTYDHLSWRRYRGRPWFSALPWLTGVAGATERIRLGTMVASPNLRHPVTLAQDAITLDHVSNGRLILGVGAGGIGFDATVFGHEALARSELVARLTEFVELLSRLLTEDLVSYDGTYYAVVDACVQPAAVQVPRIPLAIAAGGNKALELTARHADAWITFGDTMNGDRSVTGTADAVRAQIRVLEDACAAIDRDPTTIRRIFLIDNADERPLASVSAFGDFVGRYREFGFTDVVFHHPRADDPVWNEPEQIVEEIATGLLPDLHSLSGTT